MPVIFPETNAANVPSPAFVEREIVTAGALEFDLPVDIDLAEVNLPSVGRFFPHDAGSFPLQ